MATIKYNGVEIQSITECKVFEEPREMLVWNTSYDGPIEKMVCAIIPYRHEGSVITIGGAFEYCAEIPKSPNHAEPRTENWRSGWRRGKVNGVTEIQTEYTQTSVLDTTAINNMKSLTKK